MIWMQLNMRDNPTLTVRHSGFVTRLTRRVPIVEQELLNLQEHLSSPPAFSGVRVTRSLDLSVCLVDRCLSFCPFSFGHCVVSSSIYGFWWSLWYLQTLLKENGQHFHWHCWHTFQIHKIGSSIMSKAKLIILNLVWSGRSSASQIYTCTTFNIFICVACLLIGVLCIVVL